LKYEEQCSLLEAAGVAEVVQQHFVVVDHQHWEIPQGLEVAVEGEGQLGVARLAVSLGQELAR